MEVFIPKRGVGIGQARELNCLLVTNFILIAYISAKKSAQIDLAC